MRGYGPYLADGVFTGLVLTALLALPCLVGGRPIADCGGWVFIAGAGLAVISAPMAIQQGRSPSGLLSVFRPRAPEPAPERARLWLDRLLSPRNVWLIAGLTMIAVSFLPPFLRWRG
jgi:hypothetical protein